MEFGFDPQKSEASEKSPEAYLPFFKQARHPEKIRNVALQYSQGKEIEGKPC
jgi:hypothetical protein